MKIYPSRAPDEIHGLTMDFATDAVVRAGATVASVTATVEVWSDSTGTDPTPSGILVGSAILSGTIAKQFVTGGTVGVTYVINYLAVLSNGEKIKGQGRQTVSEFI